MASEGQGSGLGVRLAAIAGPMLVGLGVWWAMPEPPTWAPSAAVEAIDARFRVAPPDILAVGHSKTTTDIDPAVMRATQTPPAEFGVLQAYGSTAPTWYAMLRYRVFEQGLRPRLVLITADVPSMLSTRPSGRSLTTLSEQMPAADAVLAEKALGGHPLWVRFQGQRVVWREGATIAVRDAVVEALFAAPGEGHARAEGALALVFAAEALSGTAQAHAVPVVEVEREREPKVMPADSLVPDLVAIAQANGAKIVFVALPFAPSAARPDQVDAERERLLIELLNASGAGWVDLRGLALSDADFLDDLHLNRRGRKTLSAALLAALSQSGALEDGPIAAAALPQRPSAVRREGQPDPLPDLVPRLREAPCGWDAAAPELASWSEPALTAAGWPREAAPLTLVMDGTPRRRRVRRAELGPECLGAYAHFGAGFSWSSAAEGEGVPKVAWNETVPMVLAGGQEVWWVPPGTRLVLDVAEPWGEEELVVNVKARVFGEGAGELEVPGTGRLPLGDEELSLRGAAPAGSWRVILSSPSGGPALLVEHLGLGEGDRRELVVAQATAGSVRLFDDVTLVEGGAALSADEPKNVGKSYVITLAPALSALGNDRLTESGRLPCSPLRVADAEGTLPVVKVNELRSGAAGSAASRGLLSFNPPVGRAGEGFRLKLDTDRRCRGTRYWIYPGDQLQSAARSVQLKKLGGELGAVLIDAGVLGEGSGSLTVRLSANDTVFDAELSLAALAAGAHELPLPHGLRGDKALSISLSTASDAPFVLVESVVVTTR